MKNEHTFCPDKCSSCYIVVDILVSAGVSLLFQLENWLTKVSASNFIWIWIWCFEFTILIQIQSSNLQWYTVIPNPSRCYLFYLSVRFSWRKIMALRVLMTVRLSFHTINQTLSLERYIVTSLNKLDFWLHSSSDDWVLFSILKDGLIANTTFH